MAFCRRRLARGTWLRRNYSLFAKHFPLNGKTEKLYRSNALIAYRGVTDNRFVGALCGCTTSTSISFMCEMQ